MSDWTYVALAFTMVWGALAVYALVLARRVTQAHIVAEKLREAQEAELSPQDQDSAVCDAPPAP